MANKTLRILIADEHHAQLLRVEKMLNRLGYFRIAPVQSFNQLLALIQCAVEPFDVLIANTDLAVRAGVDLPRYCQGHQHLRHALLYGDDLLPETLQEVGLQRRVRSPDRDRLSAFMKRIDSLEYGTSQRIELLDPHARTPSPRQSTLGMGSMGMLRES